MNLSNLEQASREIASIQGADTPFPEQIRQMMRAIRGLVACDSINLGTIDLRTEEGHHLDLDGFLMPQERRNCLPYFKNQHPMLNYSRLKGISPPLRFTDFLSRRQFEETGIYRECYSGYTHSMLTFGVDAPKGLNISFVLSRQGGEFSEQETSHLAVLQPLISVVYHRLLLQKALVDGQPRDQPAGVLVGSGKNLITLDSRARQIMEDHFPNNSLHRIPESILNIIRRQPTGIQTYCDLPGGNRICGIVEHVNSEWLLRVWEESGPLPASELSRLGLTGRQVEVLQWVAKGKTNAEIAIILGISYRTVQKHLEHVYRQIGVETRLAAIDYCQNAQRKAVPLQNVK